MSTKELAYRIIDGLTEEQLNALIEVFRGWKVEIPNDETLEAIQECEDIINGKIPAKRYAAVHDLIEDIMNEEDSEE